MNNQLVTLQRERTLEIASFNSIIYVFVCWMVFRAGRRAASAEKN